jgi:hypothetical protein
MSGSIIRQEVFYEKGSSHAYCYLFLSFRLTEMSTIPFVSMKMTGLIHIMQVSITPKNQENADDDISE